MPTGHRREAPYKKGETIRVSISPVTPVIGDMAPVTGDSSRVEGFQETCLGSV